MRVDTIQSSKPSSTRHTNSHILMNSKQLPKTQSPDTAAQQQQQYVQQVQQPKTLPDVPKEPGRQKVTILVMGPTGVGKSTFINLASGSNLRVSDSLVSCTDQIEHSRPFELDNNEIVLVDTPGFDDTAKSDSDVLNIICEYLATEYSQGHLFHGILYIHRISDNRVSGTSSRNMRFYRELCGPDALKNSGIILNMWNLVNPTLAAAREEELKSKPNFFKTAIDQGANVFRHDGTIASAHGIIRHMVTMTPAPLLIQRELIDESKRVFETIAGEALLQELATLQQKHLQEMQQLEEDMNEAMQQQDEEAQRELEEERRKMQIEQEKLEVEKQKLLQLKTAMALRRQREQQQQAVSEGTVGTTGSSGPENGKSLRERFRFKFGSPLNWMKRALDWWYLLLTSCFAKS